MAEGNKKQPPSLEAAKKLKPLLEQAQSFFRRKDFKQAGKLYREVLEIEPDNIEALYQLGLIYRQGKKFDQALKKFRAILDKDVNNVAALLQMGKLYEQQNKLENALILYQKVNRLIPHEPMAIEALADVYAKKMMVKEAEKRYQSVGQMFIERQLFEPAARIYQKLNALLPNQTEILKRLIFLYEKLAWPKKLIEIKIQLAQLYEGEMLTEKAKSLYEEVLKEAPQHPVAQEKLNHLQNVEQSPRKLEEEAVELLEKMDEELERSIEEQKEKRREKLKISSPKTKIQEIITEAEIYMQHGLFDQALKEYEKVLSLAPERIEVHYQVANLYRKKKLWLEAYRVYKKILALDPFQKLAQAELEMLEKRGIKEEEKKIKPEEVKPEEEEEKQREEVREEKEKVIEVSTPPVKPPVAPRASTSPSPPPPPKPKKKRISYL